MKDLAWNIALLLYLVSAVFLVYGIWAYPEGGLIPFFICAVFNAFLSHYLCPTYQVDGTNSWWKHEAFLLNDYLAQDEPFQIRFSLESNSPLSTSDYGVLLDNISVRTDSCHPGGKILHSYLYPPSVLYIDSLPNTFSIAAWNSDGFQEAIFSISVNDVEHLIDYQYNTGNTILLTLSIDSNSASYGDTIDYSIYLESPSACQKIIERHFGTSLVKWCGSIPISHSPSVFVNEIYLDSSMYINLPMTFVVLGGFNSVEYSISVNGVEEKTYYADSVLYSVDILAWLDSTNISEGDTIIASAFLSPKANCIEDSLLLFGPSIIRMCDQDPPEVILTNYSTKDTIHDLDTLNFINPDAMLIEVFDPSPTLITGAYYSRNQGATWYGLNIMSAGNGGFWVLPNAINMKSSSELLLHITGKDFPIGGRSKNSKSIYRELRVITPCDTIPPISQIIQSLPDTMFDNYSYTVRFFKDDLSPHDTYLMVDTTALGNWIEWPLDSLGGGIYEHEFIASNFPVGTNIQYYFKGVDHSFNIFGPCPSNTGTSATWSSLVWDPTVGTIDLKISDIQFTNPANEELVFFNVPSELELTIFNQLGESVLHSKISADQDRLNIEELPAGIYVIEFLARDHQKVNKKTHCTIGAKQESRLFRIGFL